MGLRSLWSARFERPNLPGGPRRARGAHRRPVEPLERRTLLSTTLDAVADADVQTLAADASVANANFGADETLRVRRSDGETFETFLTFDISRLAGVGHAMLKMTGGQVGTPGEAVLVGAFPTDGAGFVEGDGVHGAVLDIGGNPFGELTWNNRPGSAGGAFFTSIVSGVGDYYWNLTDFVRGEKNAGKTTVTLALKHTGGGTGQVAFGSRDGSGGDAPELIVEENGAGPSAGFFAPDITGATATQQVVITYSDGDAIDPATIDTGDIIVRAPGGPALDVLGVTVQQADANSIIATYTVGAPGGSWDAADNQAYTTLLKEGEVRDAAGNPAVGGPDVFTVTIDAVVPPPADAEAPVARIPDAPPDVREEGGTGLVLRATFTDDVGVVADALTTTSLVVTRQGGAGPTLDVLDVGVEPSQDGRTVTALFSVVAPAGLWDAADNGTYDVRLVRGAVADAAGNPSNEVLTSFVVDVPAAPPPPGGGGPDTAPPVATVVPLDPLTVGGGADRQVRVTYVDDVAVNLATIDVGDLVVTGPGGAALAVTDVSVSPPTGGPSVVATYTVTAPGGSWDGADNGAYTVAVAAGAALDTANNPSAAAGANFEVAVPAPEPPVDPSFGGGAGNTVETGFVAEAATAQADGKIIVVGRQGDLAAGTSQLVIQRLNVDGSPDASFGAAGKVLGAQGANEAAYAVAVAADDGSIVVAGRRGGDLMVTRFRANGALDTRFGTGGVAVADFGGDDVAYSLVLAPDGSLVAGGGSTSAAGDAFAFARFLKDGRLDPFFGDAGRSLFAQGAGGNVAGAVTVDASGRVVGAGPTEGGAVAVVRLNANGTADGSFGTGGILVLPQLAAQSELGRPDRSIGVAAQPDGSVLVSNRSPGGDFAVAKVRADGSLDPAFGTGGVATIDFGGDDDADALLLQGSGEIFALGTTTAGGNQLAVAAIASDGSLITNFGEGGKLTVDATPTAAGRALRIGDLVLRAFGSVTQDGRLVLGASDQRPAAVTSTPLRRLNVPGSALVGTFGQTGDPAAGRRGKRLSFVDADGTAVTISLKGAGSGQVFSDGGSVDVMLSGVSNGALVITARGGADGRLTVRNLQSDGPLKSIVGKAVDLTGTMSVNGGIGKGSLGNLTGTIAAAGPIGSMLFAGDVKGTVLSGANYGVNGAPGGTGTAADGFGEGRIGKLTVAGAMVGATIAAGVDPVDNRMLDGDDRLVGGANSSIGVVTVKKGADAATRFVAGAFAAKAKLPTLVKPLEDPRFMLLQ
jgi:uncharacterized delta-60 repeat protein